MTDRKRHSNNSNDYNNNYINENVNNCIIFIDKIASVRLYQRNCQF